MPYPLRFIDPLGMVERRFARLDQHGLKRLREPRQPGPLKAQMGERGLDRGCPSDPGYVHET